MNTKQLFRCAAVIAMMFSLCYLIGAFMSASFNIAEWSEAVRAGMGFFGGVVSIAVGVAAAGYMENQ